MTVVFQFNSANSPDEASDEEAPLVQTVPSQSVAAPQSSAVSPLRALLIPVSLPYRQDHPIYDAPHPVAILLMFNEDDNLCAVYLLFQGVIEFSLCLFFAKLVSYTFLFWLPKYIKKACK